MLDHVAKWPHMRLAALDAIAYHKLIRRRAVLVADMSGFSAMTEACGTFEALVAVAMFRKGAKELVDANGGKVVKFQADNVVAVFELIAQARHAGQQIADQSGCSVGIGYGDLLLLDDDVWGAEMNAASRLGEDVALAGQVLLTSAAQAAS